MGDHYKRQRRSLSFQRAAIFNARSSLPWPLRTFSSPSRASAPLFTFSSLSVQLAARSKISMSPSHRSRWPVTARTLWPLPLRLGHLPGLVVVVVVVVVSLSLSRPPPSFVESPAPRAS